MTNGSESLMAVVDGKIIDIRCPIPQGFFTKLADGRIDDPKAGWKGKGLFTMSARAPCSITKAGREQPEGLQGADTAQPAGELGFMSRFSLLPGIIFLMAERQARPRST